MVVGLYIPPPASSNILHKITSLVATYGTDNVIVMGDFNMPPDPGVDRLSSTGGPLTDLMA